MREIAWGSSPASWIGGAQRLDHRPGVGRPALRCQSYRGLLEQQLEPRCQSYSGIIERQAAVLPTPTPALRATAAAF